MNIINSNNSKEKSTIAKLLNDSGIKEYESEIINSMNEFINSYITNILKEAKKNMVRTKREKINIEDIELAIKKKQDKLYKNSSNIHDLKFLAEHVNSYELPQIPETPLVLKPPINNNLLRNNFQIYSDELNEILKDNKKLLANASMKSDNFILGNKRNINEYNEKNKNNKTEQKNKRKKSNNQELKKSMNENNKKKGINNKNNSIENKKIVGNERISSISSGDNINDNEMDDINNNIGENSINNKKDDDMEEDEEESEEDENKGNNESYNSDVDESSYSKNNEDDNFNE